MDIAESTRARLWRPALILVQALVLALTVGGCAAKVPSSLPDDARERLARAAIATVAFEPEVSFSGPTALGGVGGGAKGALVGLGVGVLGGTGCFLSLGYVPGFCAIAVLTPYFMGRWTVEGAMYAVPEHERRQGRDAVIQAAREVSQEQLLEAVLREGRLRRAPTPVPLAAQGPTSRKQRSTYRTVAPDGIDTVVEVALLRIGLEASPAPEPGGDNPLTSSFASGVDPWLRVVAEARLRLVGVVDDGVRFERTFTHTGGHARLRDWAHDEAAEFRKARDQAIESLGRQIAEEVLGPVPRPPEAPDVDAGVM